MLTRWIVDLYAWIIEIALWCFLVASAAAGYFWTVPILSDAGWIIESERSWAIAGAILSVAAAFLLFAMILGPVVILVDVRKSVRSLEKARSPQRQLR